MVAFQRDGTSMKCYVHRDVDAVGVCHECGQGVCDACAVRIGGKLYCKTDADQVFSPVMSRQEVVEEAPSERSAGIIVSSVLFIIYSLFGIGLSVIVIIAGFAAGTFSTVSTYSSMALTSIGLLSLGGVLLLMGIVGVVCGWWLWNKRLLGAEIGIPLLVMGIVIITILAGMFPTLTSAEIAGAVWITNLLIIILLFFTWPKLRRSRESPF